MMDNAVDKELMKLWMASTELSEQLTKNKNLAQQLVQETVKLKAQAIHSSSGFALRRINTHLNKEQYESELERMNKDLSAENYSLQYDNKQLSSLLREYEQSLETIMAAFRSQAHEVQQRELSYVRNCESAILAAESKLLMANLNSDIQVSEFIARTSQLLRRTIRLLNGEESPTEEPEKESSTSIQETQRESRGYTDEVPIEDWALEKECELERLQRENEELRRLVEMEKGTLELKDIFPNMAPRPILPFRSPRGVRRRNLHLHHSRAPSVAESETSTLVDQTEALDETL